ncbi:hypothetical protein TrST_g3432 [Triparma strigata]|uniref:HTH La-type RNA-binding domain-containing protein n=1 Tax=Triparma strigata TaxID=1606541 RepID=A0A9W7E3S2_9STRA|nr:hypothetical protein TrST_g3432 [Triparma strigata]
MPVHAISKPKVWGNLTTESDGRQQTAASSAASAWGRSPAFAGVNSKSKPSAQPTVSLPTAPSSAPSLKGAWGQQNLLRKIAGEDTRCDKIQFEHPAPKANPSSDVAPSPSSGSAAPAPVAVAVPRPERKLSYAETLKAKEEQKRKDVAKAAKAERAPPSTAPPMSPPTFRPVNAVGTSNDVPNANADQDTSIAPPSSPSASTSTSSSNSCSNSSNNNKPNLPPQTPNAQPNPTKPEHNMPMSPTNPNSPPMSSGGNPSQPRPVPSQPQRNSNQQPHKNQQQKKNKKNKKKNYNYNKNSQRSTPTMSEWRDYYNRCAVAQVEYYFTEENLAKDVFLRSRMDVEGFIPLSLIVQFNAIRQLGVDYNTLRSLLVTSPYLDVDLENELVRLRNGWAKWLLSVDGSEVRGCPKYIKVNYAKAASLPLTSATSPGNGNISPPAMTVSDTSSSSSSDTGQEIS